MNMLIPPIRLALTVVDAGAHQYFIAERRDPALVARRQMLTLGSVRYAFSLASSEIAFVTLRAIGSELTTLGWATPDAVLLLPTENQYQIEDLIRNRFWDFKTWITNEVESTAAGIDQWEAHISQMVNWLITPEQVAASLKKEGGRPTPDEDFWAWEQINMHGQPKQKIRAEWEQRVENNSSRILEKENRTRVFKRITDPEWPPAKKKRP